jgi:sec-independent protein translocase protein TatB
MFDIGFTELFIIAVVGLIVIGPERLPRVARTLGHLFGRMQRYVSEVKADINREMELDELRKLQSSMQDAARDIEKSVSTQVNYIEEEVRQAESEAKKAVESVATQGSTGMNLLAEDQPRGASEPRAEEDMPAEEGKPQMELGLGDGDRDSSSKQKA